MSINTLLKIADILNLSLDYLLYGQLENSDVRSNAMRMLETCLDNEVELVCSITKTVLANVRKDKLAR